jgi:hypothetical protein
MTTRTRDVTMHGIIFLQHKKLRITLELFLFPDNLFLVFMTLLPLN